MLFPLRISVRIGKEKHGSSAQHTELFLSQLAFAACRQPYITGKEGRADNGTLFGFHQDRYLVGIDIQQVFPEQALGKLPILRQYPLPFQYAVYPVHCRHLSSLDTVSVLWIVLHHLARAYPVCAVYLPEDDSPVTGCSKTVLFQQPLQHFLCLAAVIGIKERGNEAEEVAVHALRPLHILWRYVAYACFW